MKTLNSISKMITIVVVMGIVTMTPAAVPIIIPRATARTIFGCQSQGTGTVTVTDAQHHTYTQACQARLATVLGYPGLYPTEAAPWSVIIIAWPDTIGLPIPCVFSVTRLPIHLECGANRAGQVTVDFDLILTVDIAGGWV